MTFSQELTRNDIDEGLVRVSGHNLAFFHGGESRQSDYQLQVTLPDGSRCLSRITFAQSGAPRFLRELRRPLRTFYQKVGAAIGDVLMIERVADGDFVIRYVPRPTERGAMRAESMESGLTSSVISQQPGGLESLREEQSEQSLDADIDSTSKFEYPIEDIQQRAIKTRRGQPDFRKRIFAAYGSKCAITGCEVQSVLEAAHIIPHAEGTDWDISNGLPLRADIHTLFDLGFLTVSPDYRIHISRELAGSDYEKLHGQPMALPTNDVDYPSPEKLAKHFESFQERNSHD